MDIEERLIEEAKEFALKRTEIAREARNVIESIIRRYAENFDAESIYSDMQKSELINDIMYVLRQYAEAAGTYLGDIDNGIDYFINETHGGLTYEDRVSEYVDRLFSDFVKLNIAIEFASWGSKPKKQIMRDDIVGMYRDDSIVHTAIGNGAELEIPKYGRGISKDAATQILNSVENMVNTAWGWEQWDYAVRNGATGFVYYRGSSYPCQTCQEQVGFHPMEDEFFSAPPMHSRCVCFVVYIY